ncbi:CU044_2847 family protein [Streptomyces luteogriseus]|uniref:CU044_2847 family protein n=1 Tax=Streptomyces luteogriseus TaxID=68233 RepID=UPI0037BDDF26
MTKGTTQIELPNGTIVEARVSHAERLGQGTGDYTDSGLPGAFTARVEGLTDLVRGVADTMRQATAAAAPDEVSVAFGVELAAKPGRVVSVLADGEAKASMTVTLTWRGGRDTARPDDEATAGAGTAAPPAVNTVA